MKIKFENFWPGFPVHDNIATVALKLRHCVEIVDDDADIIVYQGASPHKDNNAVTISWFIESMNRIGEPNYDNCDYSFNSCSRGFSHHI